MRLAFFIATLATLLFFAPKTFAQADNNQDNGSDPCFDAGASWEDCWTPTGYKVCAFVLRDANCTCKFGSQPADCATEGTCSYFSV